ncbi:hypothetical protein F5141DRAFT_1213323 [Pisolithus sp. B1]|nr:hypothetical protein F5141DRAFT_1213323 [Pisolithus sp. B1]
MIPLHQDDDSPSSDLVQERYLQRVIDAQHTARPSKHPPSPCTLQPQSRIRATTSSPPIPMAYPSTPTDRAAGEAGPGDLRGSKTRVKDRAKRTVAMMRLRQPFNGGYGAFQRREVDRLGVMVHRVVAEVDRGEPLIVREVPIEKDVSIEVYEERLHRVEWAIIVQATRKVPDKVRPLPPEGIDLA